MVEMGGMQQECGLAALWDGGGWRECGEGERRLISSELGKESSRLLHLHGICSPQQNSEHLVIIDGAEIIYCIYQLPPC